MGHLFGLPSLLVAVSAALLAVGLTLLRQALRGGALPGCGGSDAGCGAVTRGRWARLGPVPVALPGALVYLALLASAVATHPAVRPALSEGAASAARVVLLTAAFAAAGAGLWMAALQAAVIRQFCPYCMSAHGLAAVAAGLAVATVGAAQPAGGPAAAALALVAAFALGQCLVRPRLYAVTALPPAAGGAGAGERSGSSRGPGATDGAEVVDPTGALDSDSNSDGVPTRGRDPARPEVWPRGLPPAAVRAGDSNHPGDAGRADAPARLVRQVRLAGGNVALAAGDWPVLGSPDAPHLLALLADPTCKACRQMHRTAIDAVRLAGGWLGVLYVPVPMDPACNPAAAGRKARARADVCDYARLVLTVRAAAPAAYPAFERWLLDQPDPPPPVDQARRRAAELAPAEAGAWATTAGVAVGVEARIASAVAAYRAARLTQVPALLLPAAAIGGQLPSPPKLLDLLARELGKTAGAAGPVAAPAPPAASAAPLIVAAKANPARGGNPFAGGAAIGGESAFKEPRP